MYDLFAHTPGLVAAMIGLQIGLVFELDRPFWGALRVQPDAWTLLIHDNNLTDYRSSAASRP